MRLSRHEQPRRLRNSRPTAGRAAGARLGRRPRAVPRAGARAIEPGLDLPHGRPAEPVVVRRAAADGDARRQPGRRAARLRCACPQTGRRSRCDHPRRRQLWRLPRGLRERHASRPPAGTARAGALPRRGLDPAQGAARQAGPVGLSPAEAAPGGQPGAGSLCRLPGRSAGHRIGHDDTVPHPVIENYLSAFEQARSVDAEVLEGADHALSHPDWQRDFLLRLLGWLAGRASCAQKP